MDTTEPDDRDNEHPLFELEEEPARSPLTVQPSTQSESATPQSPLSHTSHERATHRPRREGKRSDAHPGLLDDRRRRRLLVYGSVMLILYLLLGWLFAGAGLGWFALAGIGVGIFAGWRQRGEVLLGSVAAVAGFAACLLAVGVPLLFVIVGTGMSGYIAGIDDRLRNA